MARARRREKLIKAAERSAAEESAAHAALASDFERRATSAFSRSISSTAGCSPADGRWPLRDRRRDGPGGRQIPAEWGAAEWGAAATREPSKKRKMLDVVPEFDMKKVLAMY